MDLKTLTTLLYPKYCQFCGCSGSEICFNCEARLFSHKALINCPKCSGRLHKNESIHMLCKRHSSLDGAVSLYSFNSSIKELIWDYKYQFHYAKATELANLAKARLATLHWQIDYIVPMPSHQNKVNWRGFDHISLICSKLEKPVLPALLKTKHTKAQAHLSRQARLNNIYDSIYLNPAIIVKGLSLLLIDDITTTGATLEAGAEVLKTYNAKSVFSLTIAKDDRDFQHRGVK